MTTIAELQRERETLMRKARRVTRSITDDLSADEVKAKETEFNRLMVEVDELDERIDDLAENAPDPRRPGGSGFAYGDGVPRDSLDNRWRDARTGEEVRVVQRGERLATETPTVTMGAILRSMILGPRTDAEKRALSEGTDSAGGYTVPAPLSANFIDRMRARARAFEAGAQTVQMDSETLQIAKVATDPTPSWRNENAAIAESDPAFGRVLFTARSLACYTKVSRELLEDSVNVDAALEAAFAGAFANEVDRVVLVGSGSTPEPQGIYGAGNVNEVEMGTNGAALSDYSDLLAALQALEEANADDPTAWIMAPRSKYALAGLTATDNQPLMAPSVVSQIPALATSQVPVDQTQGTATNASTIFVGDFRQVLVGVRSEFRIDVLRERFADSHQIGLVGHARVDVQLAQPTALARIVGVIPA